MCPDCKEAMLVFELEGIDCEQANPPIELPARYEPVRDEMLRQIERRFGG